MPDRLKLIVATHIFLIKDKKILLARRFQTGYEDGNYSVPAGHVEEGESVSETAKREAEEETGVKIEIKDLEFSHVMHRLSDRNQIDFFFVCQKWQGEPCNAEP